MPLRVRMLDLQKYIDTGAYCNTSSLDSFSSCAAAGPQRGHTRPVLSASDPRSISRHIFSWFFGILLAVTTPIFIVYPLLRFGGLKNEDVDVFACPENNRIRCMAHVVNLIVQATLKVMEEAESPDDVDYYFFHKDQPIHYDEADDEDLQAMEAERDNDGNDGDESDSESNECEKGEDSLLETSDLKEARFASALKRLRIITTEIVSSPQRRTSFRRCARKQYSPSQKNDKGTPLFKLIVVRDAINVWVFEHEDLRSLGLSKQDWKTLEEIECILEIFTKVTHMMSQADTPTLPFVLPMHRHMDKKLRALGKDPKYSKYSSAIDAGLQKLSKYHELAKTNQFYVVATGKSQLVTLRFDLIGLENANQMSINHVYESYASSIPLGLNSTSPVKPKKGSIHAELVQELLDDIPSDSDDGNLPSSNGGLPSEFERYIASEGGAGDSMKPLQWWRSHSKTTEDTRGFPVISHIAQKPSSMKAETTTLAVCSKVWLKSGLFMFDSLKLVSGGKKPAGKSDHEFFVGSQTEPEIFTGLQYTLRFLQVAFRVRYDGQFEQVPDSDRREERDVSHKSISRSWQGGFKI
ncbi:hypothetical protein D9758_018913 [Tetrapyrgos nigripes]|uniref:HAT C-terminal dimerisation domain-containing protein n=1 Tax=Tetrapyrgos nigripes TaxID=182062 RepID=A0A8H5BZL3_9AGAR|nr:hypothetical protein D9758_018913 [Tetrapyrgos nigripes]